MGVASGPRKAGPCVGRDGRACPVNGQVCLVKPVHVFGGAAARTVGAAKHLACASFGPGPAPERAAAALVEGAVPWAACSALGGIGGPRGALVPRRPAAAGFLPEVPR